MKSVQDYEHQINQLIEALKLAEGNSSDSKQNNIYEKSQNFNNNPYYSSLYSCDPSYQIKSENNNNDAYLYKPTKNVQEATAVKHITITRVYPESNTQTFVDMQNKNEVNLTESKVKRNKNRESKELSKDFPKKKRSVDRCVLTTPNEKTSLKIQSILQKLKKDLDSVSRRTSLDSVDKNTTELSQENDSIFISEETNRTQSPGSLNNLIDDKSEKIYFSSVPICELLENESTVEPPREKNEFLNNAVTRLKTKKKSIYSNHKKSQDMTNDELKKENKILESKMKDLDAEIERKIQAIASTNLTKQNESLANKDSTTFSTSEKSKSIPETKSIVSNSKNRTYSSSTVDAAQPKSQSKEVNKKTNFLTDFFNNQKKNSKIPPKDLKKTVITTENKGPSKGYIQPGVVTYIVTTNKEPTGIPQPTIDTQTNESDQPHHDDNTSIFEQKVRPRKQQRIADIRNGLLSVNNLKDIVTIKNKNKDKAKEFIGKRKSVFQTKSKENGKKSEKKSSLVISEPQQIISYNDKPKAISTDYENQMSPTPYISEDVSIETKIEEQTPEILLKKDSYSDVEIYVSEVILETDNLKDMESLNLPPKYALKKNEWNTVYSDTDSDEYTVPTNVEYVATSNLNSEDEAHAQHIDEPVTYRNDLDTIGKKLEILNSESRDSTNTFLLKNILLIKENETESAEGMFYTEGGAKSKNSMHIRSTVYRNRRINQAKRFSGEIKDKLRKKTPSAEVKIKDEEESNIFSFNPPLIGKENISNANELYSSGQTGEVETKNNTQKLQTIDKPTLMLNNDCKENTKDCVRSNGQLELADDDLNLKLIAQNLVEQIIQSSVEYEIGQAHPLETSARSSNTQEKFTTENQPQYKIDETLNEIETVKIEHDGIIIDSDLNNKTSPTKSKAKKKIKKLKKKMKKRH